VGLQYSESQSKSQYNVRVAVTNVGRRAARNCSGFLADVEIWRDSAFRETAYADFMRLTWAHHAGDLSLDLLPEVPYWLDEIATPDKEQSFVLQTNPQTVKYNRAFFQPVLYRLTVKVFAGDAE